MLDTPSPFSSKKIKPKAVLFRVGLRQKAGTEFYPLGGINYALEDRVLNSLTAIFAQSGYPAQSAASRVISGANVVAHEYQHKPKAAGVARF